MARRAAGPGQVGAHPGHGHVHQPAAASRVPGERGHRRVQAAERVGDRVTAEHRGPVGGPGDHSAADRRVVAERDPLLRVRPAVAGHRDPDPAGRGAQPVLSDQAQLAQGPGPAALDHHAGPAGEPGQLSAAVRRAEVEYHRLAAGVQVGVKRRRPRPGAVRAADVLDLEHAPPRTAEDAGAERAGPHRRQVQDQPGRDARRAQPGRGDWRRAVTSEGGGRNTHGLRGRRQLGRRA